MSGGEDCGRIIIIYYMFQINLTLMFTYIKQVNEIITVVVALPQKM